MRYDTKLFIADKAYSCVQHTQYIDCAVIITIKKTVVCGWFIRFLSINTFKAQQQHYVMKSKIDKEDVENVFFSLPLFDG